MYIRVSTKGRGNESKRARERTSSVFVVDFSIILDRVFTMLRVSFVNYISFHGNTRTDNVPHNPSMQTNFIRMHLKWVGDRKFVYFHLSAPRIFHMFVCFFPFARRLKTVEIILHLQ